MGNVIGPRWVLDPDTLEWYDANAANWLYLWWMWRLPVEAA